jgi:hypothetical protein
LPQSFLNPQQSYSGKAGVGTVSTFDFRSAFKRYYEVLQLLKAKVEALAPSHALNAAIAQQIEAADTRKASAPIDTAYAKTFVESVLKLHREATEVLILEQQQSARHARIHASVENALTRIDAAQKQQTVLSPNVALYLREVTEALAEGDYASLESLVPKLNDAFGLHAQQQTDAQLQHLRAFFAQMLTDMEHFGEMVLIDSVHASSPTEVKDAQRRSDCLAWVRAYHTFMENVRLGRAGDLEAERDSLELRANHLRELSIGMAEEIHHGYVAGLLLIALTEIGYPPASNAPVKIYEPITGYQGGSSISFRLRPDGTFTFTSDGFGDATCKAIYDQVLAKMNEYGVRLSAVHHWKQSEVVNKVLAVFANMGYRVDYTEQDGNIDITATNRDGEVVETRSIDADGKEITDGGQRTTARNAANRTQQQRAGIDAQQLRIKEGDADDNR